MRATKTGTARRSTVRAGRGRGLALGLALAICTGGSTLAGAAEAQSVRDGGSSPPPAKRESRFSRPGIYLAVAGGGMIETFDLPSSLTDGLSQAGYIGGKIGSRHNRWVATETSVDYAVAGFEGPNGSGGTSELRPLYLSGNVKIFVLDGRWQPWVAGGIGGAWIFEEITFGGSSTTITSGSFLGRVGGGLDVYFTDNIAFGPELYWNATTGDLEALRTLSIGANLYFRF